MHTFVLYSQAAHSAATKTTTDVPAWQRGNDGNRAFSKTITEHETVTLALM